MPIIMRIMALFSTSFIAKYLGVVEDGPGRGHLCHADTFLILDHLWVRFSKCYDTKVSVSGSSWPFYSYFSQETGFDILGILSSGDNLHEMSTLDTICMKCQILFSMKAEKSITKLSSAEFT